MTQAYQSIMTVEKVLVPRLYFLKSKMERTTTKGKLCFLDILLTIRRVAEFYKKNANKDGSHTFDFGYNVEDFYNFETGQLTPLFYKGDRSMREASYDPSCRF